jgi:hypothetical protein
MPQYSISAAPAVGYAGQKTGAGPEYSISRRTEGDAGTVHAGMPVMFGTDPVRQIRAVEAGDVLGPDTFAGFVLLSTSRPVEDEPIGEDKSVSVMRRGHLMASFSEAVTRGERVALTVAAGTLQGIADGQVLGAGQIRLPRVRVESTTTGAGMAEISVDLEGWAPEEMSPTNVANIPLGPVAYASIGTDAAGVAGTVYYSEIVLDAPKRVTGIGLLNGTTVGTDDLIVGLYDEGGHLIANSALAGTLGAGADAFQEVALTAPINLPAGRYFVASQFEGTTHQTQRIAASTYRNRAGSVAGTFGTLPATITPPTSITAGAGPVAYLY